MRTRTAENVKTASIDSLQKATGCRIHIERSHREVRLFGSTESTENAAQLLEQMELQCAEEEVLWPKSSSLPEAPLQAIATEFGVALLRKDDRCVSVLGLADAVALAATEVRKQAAQPSMTTSPDAIPGAEPDFQSKESHEPAAPLGVRKNGIDTLRENLGERTPQMQPPMAGSVLVKPQPSDDLATNQVSGQYLGMGSMKQKKTMQPADHVCHMCPSCGTGFFCTECGAPLKNVDAINNQASVPITQTPWVPQMMQGYGQLGEWYSPPSTPSSQNQSHMQTFPYPVLMVAPGTMHPTNMMMMGIGGGCVSMTPASYAGGSDNAFTNN
jgi:hypothetical protein